MTIRLKGLSLSQNLSIGRDTAVTLRWVTPAQELLGAFAQYEVVNLQLEAVGTNLTQQITYTLYAGTLPTGLSMTSGGLISGVIADAEAQPIFIIRASSTGIHADMEMQMVIGPHPAPEWVTPPGMIDFANTGQIVTANLSLLAVDPLGFPVSYYVVGGVFPPGAILNPTTGAITGVYPTISADMEYDFSVAATNGSDDAIQSFSIYIAADVPANAAVWVTPAGSVGSGYETTFFTTALEAVDPLGQGVTYVLLAGDLPEVTVLNPATGILSGTFAAQPNTTIFKFIAGARNEVYTTPRVFDVTVVYDPPPEFTQTAGDTGGILLGTVIEHNPFSGQIEATTNPNLPTIFLANGLNNAIVCNTDTGAITSNSIQSYDGKPNSPDKYTFEIILSDTVKSVAAEFEIDILPNLGAEWNISGSSLGQGLGSTPFDTGTNPLAFDPLAPGDWPTPRPIVYTLDPSTPMPDGLTFDPSIGRIYGTLPEASTANVVIPVLVTANIGSLAPISVNPGPSVTKEFTITSLFNTPPVWDTPAGSLGSVVEDYTGSFQISAHDRLGIQAVGYQLLTANPVAPGLNFDNATGILSGTAGNIADPDQDIYEFTVLASYQNNVLPTTRTFSVTIDQNYPPVWVTPAGQIGYAPGGGNFKATVVASDPNGLPLNYTLLQNNIPSTITFSNGEFNGTMPDTFISNVSYFAEVGVAAAQSVTVSQTFILTSLLNLPPVWDSNSGTIADLPEQSDINVQLFAHDPEGNAITYLLNPGSGTNYIIKGDSYIVNLLSNGLVTGNLPPVTQDSSYPFTVYASDNTNFDGSTPIYATPNNFNFVVRFVQPPVWQAPFSMAALEQTPFTQQILATGTGNQGFITYTLTSGSPPPGITFVAANSTLIGTTPGQATDKTYTFTVVANNGTKTSNATFNFTVFHNLPPVWSNAGLIGSHLGQTSLHYTLSATDPNGIYSAPLTYAVSDIGNTPSTVYFTSDSDGLHMGGYLPLLTQNTTYSFTATVSDGLAAPVAKTFSIIDLQNENPIWSTPGGAPWGDQLGGHNFSYSLSAADPEGNTVTFALANSTMAPPGLTLSANGTLTGTFPFVANTNTTVFDVAADDGTPLYSYETFSLTIDPNLPPYWITPAGNLGIVVAGYPMPAVVAADPQSETLTYSLTEGSLPPGVTMTATGITGSVDLDLQGAAEYDFQVSVTDGFSSNARNFYVLAYPNLLPEFIPNSGAFIADQFEQTLVNTYVSAVDPNPGGSIKTQKVVFDPGLSGFTFNASTGQITGTLPPVDANTLFSVAYTANNGIQEATASYTIEAIFNSPPVFQPPFNLPDGTESNVYPPVSVGAPVFVHAVSNIDQIFYSVTGGEAPPGIAVLSNGMVTGTAPFVATPTTYTFQVTATTGIKASNQNYTITVNPDQPPVWQTPAFLGNVVETSYGTFTMLAIDPNELPITYTLDGGNLPNDLLFWANNGSGGCVVNGTAAALTTNGLNESFTFTVGADNGFITTEMDFTIQVLADQPPVWITNAGVILTQFTHTAVSYTLVANSAAGKTVTYSENAVSNAWPSWLTINSGSGLLTGTLPPVFANTTIPFDVDASDSLHYSTRSFEVVDLWNASNFDSAANTVSVLLNFNSAPITDVEGLHTITNSNVTIDTLFPHTGAASGRFTAASNSFLTIPSDTNTNLNPFYTPGNLTIEFWVRVSSLSNSGTIFSILSGQAGGGSFSVIQSGGSIVFGSTWSGQATHSLPVTLSDTNWHHCALVGFNGVAAQSYEFSCYFDGNPVSGVLQTGFYNHNGLPTYFGCSGAGNSFFDGWIDDIRYTPSERYTGAFVPAYQPAAPLWVSPANGTVVAMANELTTFQASIPLNISVVDPAAGAGLVNYVVLSSNVPGLTISANGVATATMPVSGPTLGATIVGQDTNGNFTLPRTVLFQSNAVAANGMVASWRFNRDIGSTNFNVTTGPNGFSTTNLYSGTPPLYATSPGHTGQNSMYIQYVDGAVGGNVGTYFSSTWASNYTIEFWMYLPSGFPNPNYQFAFYGGVGNSYGVAYQGSWVLFTPSGSLTFGNIPTNAWSHLAIVKNGTTTTTYLNGISQGTGAVGVPLNNVNMAIGDFYNLAGYGKIGTQFEGMNFWNYAKYSANFTPVWPSYP